MMLLNWNYTVYIVESLFEKKNEPEANYTPRNVLLVQTTRMI